jgi:hypothetical protein|tara:strand:+ start:2242 stop:2553 length:312 start_codon:yes stop_codon:yes gene_type:complete
MGLINNDSITLHSGIEVSNAYYSLFQSSISLTKKTTGEITFHVDFGVWKDKGIRQSTYEDEYSPLKYHTIIVSEMTEEDLLKNLFVFSYERLKLELSNYTDDL